MGVTTIMRPVPPPWAPREEFDQWAEEADRRADSDAVSQTFGVICVAGLLLGFFGVFGVFIPITHGGREGVLLALMLWGMVGFFVFAGWLAVRVNQPKRSKPAPFEEL